MKRVMSCPRRRASSRDSVDSSRLWRDGNDNVLLGGLILLLCLLIMAVTASNSRAMEVPSILILPFDNATEQTELDSLKTGFPDILTAFLTPYEEKLKVIDRSVMEAVYTEGSIAKEGFIDKGSYAQLGQLLQAQYILRGSFSGTAKNLSVNVFLYEAETTRLVKSFEKSASENFSLSAQSLAQDIAGVFNADIQPLAELPTDDDPEKSLNMIYGLGYYHNGQFEKALTYFMKILEKHPQDESGGYWLAKTFKEAGMKEHAKLEMKNFREQFPQSERSKEFTGATSTEKFLEHPFPGGKPRKVTQKEIEDNPYHLDVTSPQCEPPEESLGSEGYTARDIEGTQRQVWIKDVVSGGGKEITKDSYVSLRYWDDWDNTLHGDFWRAKNPVRPEYTLNFQMGDKHIGQGIQTAILGMKEKGRREAFIRLDLAEGLTTSQFKGAFVEFEVLEIK